MKLKVIKSNNTRAFLLLAFMAIFAFISSLVFSSKSPNVQTSETKTGTSKSVVLREVTAQAVNTQSPAKVEAPSPSQAVLAATSSTANKCEYVSEYRFQPVCSSDTVSTSYADGSASINGNEVRITDKSIIRLEKVTYPGALLEGIDENIPRAMIKNGFPAWGNGCLVSATEYTSWDVPAISQKYKISDDPRERGIFESTGNEEGKSVMAHALDLSRQLFEYKQAGLGVRTSANGGDTGESIAAVGGKSLNTNRDMNPMTCNYNNSTFGKITMLPYSDDASRPTSRNYAGECKDIQNFTDIPKIESDCFQACKTEVSVAQKTSDFVKSLVSWNECQNGTGDCTYSYAVSIQVDAPFGSNNSCEEGENCSAMSSGYSYSSMEAPHVSYRDPDGPIKQDTGYLPPVYVRTNCAVSIDGISHDIDCLWDFSTYFYDYYRQRTESVPNPDINDPNAIPYSWDVYWQSVHEYIQNYKKNSC